MLPDSMDGVVSTMFMANRTVQYDERITNEYTLRIGRADIIEQMGRNT
jgi:hypothetical protein